MKYTIVVRKLRYILIVVTVLIAVSSMVLCSTASSAPEVFGNI